MTKLFNPQITPGEWEAERVISTICSIYTKIDDPMYDNKKTIAKVSWGYTFTTPSYEANANIEAIIALPQLLKVLEAARELIRGAFIENEYGYMVINEGDHDELKDAIQELDDKHGTQQ